MVASILDSRINLKKCESDTSTKTVSCEGFYSTNVANVISLLTETLRMSYLSLGAPVGNHVSIQARTECRQGCNGAHTVSQGFSSVWSHWYDFGITRTRNKSCC